MEARVGASLSSICLASSSLASLNTQIRCGFVFKRDIPIPGNLSSQLNKIQGHKTRLMIIQINLYINPKRNREQIEILLLGGRIQIGSGI